MQQHRLRCSVAASDARDEEFSETKASSKLINDLTVEVKQLSQKQEELKHQISQVRLLLLLFLVYFLASGIWRMFTGDDVAHSQSCQTLSSHM